MDPTKGTGLAVPSVAIPQRNSLAKEISLHTAIERHSFQQHQFEGLNFNPAEKLSATPPIHLPPPPPTNPFQSIPSHDKLGSSPPPLAAFPSPAASPQHLHRIIHPSPPTRSTSFSAGVSSNIRPAPKKAQSESILSSSYVPESRPASQLPENKALREPPQQLTQLCVPSHNADSASSAVEEDVGSGLEDDDRRELIDTSNAPMPPVAPAPLPAPPKADDIDDAKAFPLLSGYLYKLGRNNKWQWRLFRFDGTLFTCLSPTVIKIENPGSTFTLSSSLYVPTSTPMPFITSPLLTGVSNPSECGNVLHVQLPKWTIHMADVEQIGLVRKPKKSKKDGKEEDTRAAPVNGAAGKPTEPVFNFNGARNCFLIRTHDGRNHIMRAKRNEDLERWLFVLVRMWKVAVDAKLKGPSPSIDSIPPADPFDRYKRDIPFVPPPQEASPEGASELPKDPPPYPSATAQSTSTGKEIPRKAPPTADESPRGAVIVRRPSAENLDEEDGNWVDDATLERSGVRIVPIIMPVQAETGKATGTAGGGMLSPPTSPTRMYGSSLPLSPTTPKSKNVRFMQVLNDMGEDDVQIEQPRAVKRLQTASLTPGVGPLGLEEAAAKADANSTNPFAGAARHGRAPSNPLLYYPARTASLLHAPEQLHEIPTFAPPPSFVRGVVKGILKRPTVDVGTGASSGSFGLVPPERKGSIGVVDGVSTLAGLGGGGMLHRRSMTAPVAIEYSIDMGQNYVAPTPVVPTSLVNTQSPLAAISEREEEESDGIGHLAELATPPPTTKLRSRGSKDKESRKRDSTLRRNKESAPVIQWHEGETVSGNGDAPGIGFDGGETVAAWRDTLGRVARRHSGYQQL